MIPGLYETLFHGHGFSGSDGDRDAYPGSASRMTSAAHEPRVLIPHGVNPLPTLSPRPNQEMRLPRRG